MQWNCFCKWSQQHRGSEFLPEKKAFAFILFKHSCCSNKKQGGLWNYVLKANYIPQARVMPLDRYIKHKYLYTLSLILKDDSKVKQISKYLLTLPKSNHHHPVKPVALLSVKMTCHHIERLFNVMFSLASHQTHRIHKLMEVQKPYFFSSQAHLSFWLVCLGLF